eukprot:1151458-Pelagomonas_calceolata.AAC.1
MIQKTVHAESPLLCICCSWKKRKEESTQAKRLRAIRKGPLTSKLARVLPKLFLKQEIQPIVVVLYWARFTGRSHQLNILLVLLYSSGLEGGKEGKDNIAVPAYVGSLAEGITVPVIKPVRAGEKMHYLGV